MRAWKCMEQLFLSGTVAYKPKLDAVTKHFDSANTLVTHLSMNLSAVNIVNRNALLYQSVDVEMKLVLWIKDFLTYRPQHIKVYGIKSTSQKPAIAVEKMYKKCNIHFFCETMNFVFLYM